MLLAQDDVLSRAFSMAFGLGPLVALLVNLFKLFSAGVMGCGW